MYNTQTTNYYASGLEMEYSASSDFSDRDGASKNTYLYNGKEMDRMHGLNMYDYGARGYDPALASWTTVDPLAEKRPWISTYVYCSGNPINRVDPDGKFDVEKYDDTQLAGMELNRKDYDNFVSIVNNLSSIADDNAVDVMSQSTGFEKEKVSQDIQKKQGPKIEITMDRSKLNPDDGARGDKNGIYVNPKMIKYLGQLLNDRSGDNEASIQNQVVYLAMTIFHEYGHYGDQNSNNGFNTGQWTGTPENKVFYDFPNCKDKGSQRWDVTKTGHRGIDIENLGFKMPTSIMNTKNGLIEGVDDRIGLDRKLRAYYFNKLFKK